MVHDFYEETRHLAKIIYDLIKFRDGGRYEIVMADNSNDYLLVDGKIRRLVLANMSKPSIADLDNMEETLDRLLTDGVRSSYEYV